jgi:UDP-N-acetyl-2-amino-2-deoxyglucuronate dehydrogenase
MVTKPVRFAILGGGMIADYHRAAIAAHANAGAELAAIGHHQPARFAELSARFGVPCRPVADVLADDSIDAVCICTPSGEHAAQAIAAAEAGKHVLVEKPMALRLDDADAMIAACKRNDVRLGVALQRRYEPIYERVQGAIAAGDLGDLSLGVVVIPYHRPQAYYETADWRGTWLLDGGGVLMNQGIHLVDLLVWFMGDPIAVQARAATLQRKVEVEDTLAATLRFANGALATIAATTTAWPGFPHRVEIYGSAGGIQIEGESVRQWQSVAGEKDPEPSPPHTIPAAGSGSDPRGIALDGHIAVLGDFLRAVHTGRPPRIDGAEGRRSLAAVSAIYEAAGLPGHSDDAVGLDSRVA